MLPHAHPLQSPPRRSAALWINTHILSLPFEAPGDLQPLLDQPSCALRGALPSSSLGGALSHLSSPLPQDPAGLLRSQGRLLSTHTRLPRSECDPAMLGLCPSEHWSSFLVTYLCWLLA